MAQEPGQKRDASYRERELSEEQQGAGCLNIKSSASYRVAYSKLQPQNKDYRTQSVLGIDRVVGPRVSFLSISRAPDYLQIHRLIPTSNSDVACVDKAHCESRVDAFDLTLTSSRTCRIACSYSSRQAAQHRQHTDAEHGRQGNIGGDHLGTPYGVSEPARPRWRRAKHLRTATARSLGWLASSGRARQQRRCRLSQPGRRALRHKRTHHSRLPVPRTVHHLERLGLQRILLLLANLCLKRLGSL